VYGIVKQSGGCIAVDSAPGAGTVFEIYLPHASAPAAPARPASDAPAADGCTETVLLVEDEEGVRALAERLLARQGYRVLAARDGTTALRLAAAHAGDIHLLLTDVVMPGMSGRELAQRIQLARPDVRVLYMSGYTEDEIVRRGLGYSPAALVQKPFTADSLTRAVRATLDAAERAAGCSA